MLRSIPLCVLLPAALAGCLTEEDVTDELPAADFVDVKGNAWRKRGPAPLAPSAHPRVESTRYEERATENESLSTTEAELAAKLRPVAYFEGDEYELVASDEELLARYRLLEATGRMGGDPQAPVSPGPRPTGWLPTIFGDDDRLPLGYNVHSYPSSAVGVSESSWYPPYFGIGSGQCTITMIGPSTAISAAHCFYEPGVGWDPTKSWTFGMTSWLTHDTTMPIEVTQAYPTYTGCYWVTVPGAWTTLQREHNWNDVFWDFAVIEFSNSQAPTCNLFPGHSLGWYGWWTASDDQIARSNVRVNGYPFNIPTDYSRVYAWPTQFTQGDYAGSAYTNTADRFLIFNRLDITGGNSGSVLAQELFASGDRYATGIIAAELPHVNLARRIDATVRSFVLQYSAL